MNTNDQLPPQTYRFLGFAVVLLLLTTILGIGLISAGVFDPKPIGRLQLDLELKSISVEPGAEETFWQIEAIGQDAATLRLGAAWRDGELDVGYGLAIGNEENYLIVGISPLGYATVQFRGNLIAQESARTPIFPWQTWPHIHSDQLENEIWVDIKDGYITAIRINRELLIEDSIPVPGLMVGLWLQSYGQGVEITFQDLRLYYTDPNS